MAQGQGICGQLDLLPCTQSAIMDTFLISVVLSTLVISLQPFANLSSLLDILFSTVYNMSYIGPKPSRRDFAHRQSQ